MTWLASTDSGRHAASAASRRDSAPRRSSTLAASTSPPADRLRGRAFERVRRGTESDGVAAGHRIPDRRQPHRQVLEEHPDHIGHQLVVAGHPAPQRRPRRTSAAGPPPPAARRRRRPVRPRRTGPADRSASRDSRPCRRPGTARDRWSARAPSSPRSGCARRSCARAAESPSSPRGRPCTGICRSISTRSNASRSSRVQRLAAVLDHRHRDGRGGSAAAPRPAG